MAAMEYRTQKHSPVLISELIADPPSDEALAKIIPHPRFARRPYIKRMSLMALKHLLEGKSMKETAALLGTSAGNISRWTCETMFALQQGPFPDYLEIDVPALRKEAKLPVNLNGTYTKISELLADMPSDEEIVEQYLHRGLIPALQKKRLLTQKDLNLLQQRLAGRTFADIGRELGISVKYVHDMVSHTRQLLLQELGLENDIPGFPDICFGKRGRKKKAGQDLIRS